jgi:hypothetical protein
MGDPFLNYFALGIWIWAMAYRPERGWGFSTVPRGEGEQTPAAEVEELRQRIAILESRASAESKAPPEIKPAVASAPRSDIKPNPESTAGIRSS